MNHLDFPLDPYADIEETYRTQRQQNRLDAKRNDRIEAQITRLHKRIDNLTEDVNTLFDTNAAVLCDLVMKTNQPDYNDQSALLRTMNRLKPQIDHLADLASLELEPHLHDPYPKLGELTQEQQTILVKNLLTDLAEDAIKLTLLERSTGR